MHSIVLLSGGLDSCVVLAHALSVGRTCIALSFDYGQRHLRELHSARQVAAYYGVEHLTLRLDPLLFSSCPSSLTNRTMTISCQSDTTQPSTYVPCRNLLFLAHAASLAESKGAREIFFGAHAQDGPSYPDCRPDFFAAVETAVHTGSYAGAHGFSIICPLATYDKSAVVAYGRKLGAPLDLTWSCYDPRDEKPCTVCPACTLRAASLRH